MSIKAKISDFRRSIQDKCREQQGLTIVEVMVAFVLVLLAIGMITTVTMLAGRIQKQTKESQQRMTQLAESAYHELQPVYDPAEKRWKTQIPAAEISNESTVMPLTFTGNGMTFHVDVQTADWIVSAVSDAAIQTTYHIYR